MFRSWFSWLFLFPGLKKTTKDGNYFRDEKLVVEEVEVEVEHFKANQKI